MKYLSEINENVQFLTEGEGEAKKHYIKGLFLEFDAPNRNRRIYRSEWHDPVVKEYVEEKVKTNRAWGELDHPEGPTINLKNASHRTTDLWKEGSNWYGKAIVLDTPMGNVVKGLLASGGNLGVSSRGLGSVKSVSEEILEVQPDFKLVTVSDIVSDPSAHGALVNGIMENVNWFYKDGQWLAEQSSNLKNTLKTMNVKEIEAKKLQIFENFMKSLVNK